MKVAVIGGGVVGLFTAFYLEKEGAEVTLFETGELGARSAHAAGIIEPSLAYRTNTLAFLRRVWRYWRNGTCTFRRVDANWFLETVRHFEREPLDRAKAVLKEMGEKSVAAYEALAEENNDFSYTPNGVAETYDDAAHFTEERTAAISTGSVTPVEVREAEGGAGSLYFPKMAWLHTERFVQRMLTKLTRTRVVRQRVKAVTLDGVVSAQGAAENFDAVAVCTGVASRKLGIPLTGVRGYGWRVRSPTKVDVATIHVDRGIALVPFENELKVTGGWDFDLSTSLSHSHSVFDAVSRLITVDRVLSFSEGSRPCTPDGLPTVGRRGKLIAANGGFRLGWSFAPAMGQAAALLCLDQTSNDPFLARFCGTLHSGSFA